MCLLSAEHLLCELTPLVNEIAQLESLIQENKYHDIVHAYGVCVSKIVALIESGIQPSDPIQ